MEMINFWHPCFDVKNRNYYYDLFFRTSKTSMNGNSCKRFDASEAWTNFSRLLEIVASGKSKSGSLKFVNKAEVLMLDMFLYIMENDLHIWINR